VYNEVIKKKKKDYNEGRHLKNTSSTNKSRNEIQEEAGKFE